MNLIVKSVACVAILGYTMAVGMETQIPQDVRGMLQQHKDLTLRNKKITWWIKFIGLEASILSAAFFAVEPVCRFFCKMDSKYLSNILARTFVLNGNKGHDICAIGLSFGAIVGFSIAFTATILGLNKFVNRYIATHLPGERKRRMLADTIAGRALANLSAEQITAIFRENFKYHADYGDGGPVQTIDMYHDRPSPLGNRLYRIQRFKEGSQDIERIVREFGYPWP